MSITQRMTAVQAPVIPIIGDLIRANPGTISLGQGIVHYPPPPSVRASVNDFFADADNNKYKAVEGISPLLEALSEKLRSKNRSQSVRSTASSSPPAETWPS